MAEVFLMGTAGNSQWRTTYINALNGVDRSYYNPVVPNWTAADGEREATALVEAFDIVMVITTETEGIGSLAETGWTIANALKRGQRVGMYIEGYWGEEATQHDASQRARKLVLSHARKFAAAYPDVLFVAQSHEELLAWLLRPVAAG